MKYMHHKNPDPYTSGNHKKSGRCKKCLVLAGLLWMVWQGYGLLRAFGRGSDSRPYCPDNGSAEVLQQDLNQMPYLYQIDLAWKDLPYGDTNIETAGCGPTSISMVLSWLTGNAAITPAAAAAYADSHGFYVEGVGTSWSFFEAYADAFGIDCEPVSLGDASRICQLLEDGYPMIFCMNPGDFTTAGHIIAASPMTMSDKSGSDDIQIHDPYSPQRSRLWPVQTILSQAAGAFVFSYR